MDEAESLEALSNILTSISETPYDFSLHVQHINVAETLGEGQQDHALTAREMMTGFWAAGEEVWFPLINAKKTSVDLDTEEGVAEVLEVYEKAEDDYLCEPRPSAISLLVFILTQPSKSSNPIWSCWLTGTTRSRNAGALPWAKIRSPSSGPARPLRKLLTRASVTFPRQVSAWPLPEQGTKAFDAESRTLGSPSRLGTRGARVIDARREVWCGPLGGYYFRSQDCRSPHVSYIEEMFLTRLRQPHSSMPPGLVNVILLPTDWPSDPDNDTTFQAYSSFTTGYKPPTEYESLLVIASKARTGAVKSYAWKETREAVLVRTIHSIICLSH